MKKLSKVMKEIVPKHEYERKSTISGDSEIWQKCQLPNLQKGRLQLQEAIGKPEISKNEIVDMQPNKENLKNLSERAMPIYSLQ